MTNEKKALQLAGLNEISEEERYYQSSKCAIYDKCLEMAEWKDAEFDDETARILFLKICYFLQESECLSQTFDWEETSKRFIEYLNKQ